MDAAELLERLNVSGELPVEAIRAASANRAAMAPVFVAAIEDYLSSGTEDAPPDALFFIFICSAEWREHSAYRPLARLLRIQPAELDLMLGDAITVTPIGSWRPFSTAILGPCTM